MPVLDLDCSLVPLFTAVRTALLSALDDLFRDERSQRKRTPAFESVQKGRSSHGPDGRNQNLAEGQEGLGLLEEIGSGLEMAAAQTQQIPRSDHWLQRSEPEYRECRSLNHTLVKRYCRVARTTARASV